MRLMGAPLAPGEMRPLVNHSAKYFALALCPGCRRALLVSERGFRELARDQGAALACDGCGRSWRPTERIPESKRHTPDIWVPRDGWR